MSEDAGGSTTHGWEGFAPEGFTENLGRILSLWFRGHLSLSNSSKIS